MSPVAPPFIVVGLLAFLAFIASASIESQIHGGFINLDGLAYIAAGIGVFSYTSVFFWIDWFLTFELPGRAWATHGAMWWRVFVAALIAVGAAFGVGGCLVTLLLLLRGLGDSVGQVVIGVVGLALVASTICGAVMSVLARRGCTISGPRWE